MSEMRLEMRPARSHTLAHARRLSGYSHLEMVTVAEVFEDGTEETLPACMELEG